MISLSFFFAFGKAAFSQVYMNGPTCVQAGEEYLYYLTGSYSNNDYIEWCVSNGTTANGNTCENGYGLNYIMAKFTTSDQITVYTPYGAAFLDVTVAEGLHGGSISSNNSQTINYNHTPATINCSAATGGGCYPSYEYQWEQSADGSNWSPMSGKTSENLSFSAGLTQSTFFRRRVTSGSNTVAYSGVATVYVIPPPLVPGLITTPSFSVPYNTKPANLMATVSTGGSCSSYTYQWQRSSNNTTWSNASSGGVQDYTFPANQTASYYYRRRTTCGTATEYTNTVAVLVAFNAGTLNASQSIAPGGGVTALTISSTGGGEVGATYTYLWERSTDEITWTPISGAAASTYTPAAPSQTTYYRVKVSCATASVYTNTVSIRVVQPAAINIPNSSVATPSQTAVAMPAYPAGIVVTNMNYVRTRTFVKPGMTTLTTGNAQTDKLDVSQATEYFDGLGRPLQTVVKNGTPLGKDLISTTWYDAFGRVAQQYLPYSDNLETGNFRLDPQTKQPAFYNTYFSNTESFYYSNNIYEPSPLNQVLKQTAPGKSWTGSSKGVRVEERTNRKAEDVKIWTIGSALGSVPLMAGAYNEGELFVQVSTDEGENKVIEYKDKEGKVVLKKVQASDLLQEAHSGWLCTYYIYDDFNRLRYVLPPKAVEWLLGKSWSLTTSGGSTVQTELCFRYEYDAHGRMIIKRVPGAGEVWMVYDARDRLVMTQDANLRVGTKKWLVTEYDNLNRLIRTGLWTNASDRVYHEGQAGSASAPIPYPVVTTGYEVLTETYYDNYSYTGAKAYDASYNAQLEAGTNRYAQTNSQSSATRGLVTGSKVKVLGSASQYLVTSTYYDERGRAIQVLSDNVTGGVDITTNQYDYSGKLLSSLVRHQKGSGTGAPTTTVLTKLHYDHNGRVMNVKKKLNGSADKLITQNTYDELGQLKTKQIGQKADLTFLETQDYSYTIRGWLKGINKDYANKAGTSAAQYSRRFGMELSYDFGFVKNQLDGNIAGVKWRSQGDDEQRAFGYDYDNVNRLLKGDFTQNNGGWNTSKGLDFSVGGNTATGGMMKYDANGNIMEMWQKGWKLSGSDYIDELTYTYNTTSNKLKNVIDAKTNKTTALGDFRYSALYEPVVTPTKAATVTDYTYDGNGNLLKDLNKDIGNSSTNGIVYNYLNLPQTITVYATATAPKGTITYTYDAAGNKLQKTVVEGSNKTVTTYVGGFVYEGKCTGGATCTPVDVLQFIGHEEGRIRYKPAGGTYVYDYLLKDHLGNTRMVLTEEQETLAYPAASMENVVDKANLSDPANYIPYYDKTDYTTNAALRYPISSISGYPADTYTSPNQYVAKLRGDGQKIGPSIVLKVMSGDKFNLRVSSWYKQNGVAPGTAANPLSDLILALSGNIAPLAAGKATQTELQNSTLFSGAADAFLQNRGAGVTTKPKAFVNWILFDEQFQYVSASSGFEQVGADASATVNPHTRSNLPITKNGYLYVYVSNETPNIDVFFDNLQVTHIKGPLLEETHYYPFGLTMTGISSRAAGGIQSRYKFNGGNELQSAEFSDGSGMELYDAVNRMYDPQLGRFWQVDELAEGNWEWTPYNFAINNPLRFNDPFGLKEGPNDVKELPNVTVVGTRGLWANTRLYYSLLTQTGGNLNRIVNNSLREKMHRIDGIVKHRERVAEMTRESDKVALATAATVGSLLIPASHITKLRYLKYAGDLFKIKRGLHVSSGAADLASQIITNRGDVNKINLLTTASATLIGNPFLSTVPGGFANLSINAIRSGEIVNSVTDFNVYKNIVISTLGNMGGGMLGNGFKNGSTLPGGQFIGETLGATGASIYDQMTNTKQ